MTNGQVNSRLKGEQDHIGAQFLEDSAFADEEQAHDEAVTADGLKAYDETVVPDWMKARAEEAVRERGRESAPRRKPKPAEPDADPGLETSFGSAM